MTANNMALENIMNSNSNLLQQSMERLSTGYKVNSAADGAAELAISNSLDSQIRGYGVATSNVQQGLSMLGDADSALQNIVNHLQNIRDIAVAAGNSTNSSSDFANYQTQLTAEIGVVNNIATNTKFGSNVLLNGSVASGAGMTIQIGPNSSDTLDIKSAFSDNQTSSGFSITQTSIASTTNAGTLLTQADAAIATANANLAAIGGYENRLTDQLSYLATASTNTASAQASIRDTDVAQETSNMARLQILQQAGAYVLAQQNSQGQLALSLLQSTK